MMIIRQITKADRGRWADFRAALWPEDSADAHLQEIDRVLASGDLWVFFAELEGRAVGFAEVSLRRYANGCEQQPVTFLEGIYVAPGSRRKGVGQKLTAHLRDFLRARGYTELCSDALLANTASQAAHKAWGFAETERVVYFRTPL
jgi:aminoglycoside 6'-N-acetyltransferase I